MNIKELQAGTTVDSSAKDEATTSSPTIGKPNVVRSPSLSVNGFKDRSVNSDGSINSEGVKELKEYFKATANPSDFIITDKLIIRSPESWERLKANSKPHWEEPLSEEEYKKHWDEWRKEHPDAHKLSTEKGQWIDLNDNKPLN